jgi:hypothetical protein
MIDITFICCPKPFIEPFKDIQTNAIISWKKLKYCSRIVMCCNEEGSQEFCKEYDIIHEPNVEVNEFNTPLLHSIFKLGYKHANKYVCFINSDIILLNDFDSTIEKIFNSNLDLNNCLLVGQQWSWKKPYLIDFNKDDYKENILKEVKNDNKQNDACAIDYFVHSITTYENILPFAIGRCHFDRWLMYEALRLNRITIDMSQTIIAIHQDGPWLLNYKQVTNINYDIGEYYKNRFGIVNCHETGKNIDDSKYKTIFIGNEIALL